MNNQLLIATDHGVHIIQRKNGTWEKTHSALINHRFTTVSYHGNAVMAGTRDGLYQSLDSGQSWREINNGLLHRHIRSVCYDSKDSDTAFAGTEPAAIFITHDRGENWQERPEVAHLREKYHWSLPYSPNAGCVRDFAFRDGLGYAAVEQGGLLRSNDGGKTWHLMHPKEEETRVASATPWIHADVHSVFVHPTSNDQVFAPTGGGLYYSTSGGRSWDQLHDYYCRAVWVDPQRATHIILGIAAGPDRNGQIVESINGGKTWDIRMQGMETVWQKRMVEQFLLFEDRLFALLSDGLVISSPLESIEWRPVFGDLIGVRAMTSLT